MNENTGEKDTSRVEAFSDGVFAIAITLLIIEIKVPHLPYGAPNSDLLKALLSLWPSFLAFVISFVAILIMWVNHHGMFNLVRAVDSRFLYSNGFLLLLIAFVPFPTAVLAEYLDHQAANTAVALYCGTYVLICIAYNLLWHAAAENRRLMKTHVSDSHIRKIRRAYRLALPVYLLAVVVAFFNAIAGLVICSSLWGLWTLLNYRATSEPQVYDSIPEKPR